MLQTEIDQERITAFCEKWQVIEIALFGSILRDDFRPDSDVDVLVSFSPTARHTLFDLVHMQAELADIFGRDVDLFDRSAVERSRNYLRRKEVLGTLHVLHAA